MELIKRITDKDILGTEDITVAEPQKAVRAVLMDWNGLVAVMYIADWVFYMLPGGRMESGETVLKALEREVLEETGCRLEVIRELGTIDENRAFNNYRLFSYCYLAKVKGKKGNPSMMQDEIDAGTEVRWHSPRKVLELIEDQDNTDYVMKFIRKRELVLLNEAIKHI